MRFLPYHKSHFIAWSSTKHSYWCMACGDADYDRMLAPCPARQQAAILAGETDQPPAPSVADMVVTPKHYARFEIEPIRFIGVNGLNWWQGNIVKYICRHDAKSGREDVLKAIRYAIMFYRFLAGDPDWHKPDPFTNQIKEAYPDEPSDAPET